MLPGRTSLTPSQAAPTCPSYPGCLLVLRSTRLRLHTLCSLVRGFSFPTMAEPCFVHHGFQRPEQCLAPGKGLCRYLSKGRTKLHLTDRQLRLGFVTRAVRGTAGTGSPGCLDPEVLVPSPWRRQGTWDPEHRCREDPSKGTRGQGTKGKMEPRQAGPWTPALLSGW